MLFFVIKFGYWWCDHLRVPDYTSISKCYWLRSEWIWKLFLELREAADLAVATLHSVAWSKWKRCMATDDRVQDTWPAFTSTGGGSVRQRGSGPPPYRQFVGTLWIGPPDCARNLQWSVNTHTAVPRYTCSFFHHWTIIFPNGVAWKRTYAQQLSIIVVEWFNS